MSLVKCKECGAQVSTEAVACSACGAKQQKAIGTTSLVVAGFMLFAIVKCTYEQSTYTAPPPPAPEIALAQAKEQALFQRDVQAIKTLRATLKNPKSFELVQALRMDNQALCVTYRATNSFNAVITEHKAISSEGKAINWNSDCANKRAAADVSYIKHAL